MKILFVVPYVPDLIRVRPYNLIRFLTQLGHEVTVFTLWTHEFERQAAHHLEQHCHAVQAFHLPKWQSYLNVLKTVPSRVPLQASYCWHPTLVRHAVQQIQAQQEKDPFDVIHVEHLRGARLGLALKKLCKTPVVWDSVDSISYLFRQAVANSKRGFDRFITRFELGRTERYERWLTDQFAQTLVTSQADKAALEALRLEAQSTQRPSNPLLICHANLQPWS